MSTFLQDLRYGVRMLLSGGPVTLVAVVTLALGIGANTAIFSIVNGILLKPLPYERPAGLVLITERHLERPISVSWLNYADWRAQQRVFVDMGATSGLSVILTRLGADPERLVGARATASYFRTLGVPTLLGRTFRDEEDRPGGEFVTVLTEGLWQRVFGGDPSVIGRSLTLNGSRCTIIGVMPARFVIQNPPIELWTSMGRISDRLGPRSNHTGISVVARLKPGVTIEQSRAEMDTVAARLAQEYAENRHNGIIVEPLHDRVIGGDLRSTLLVLLGAVGFVLLIACANVANLLLARGAARQREIAVRTALGAGRARLLRQLLTESVLLAAAGGVAGVVVGWWGLRVLLAAVPDNLARMNEVRVDAPVLTFTAALAILTGLIFGLAPALQVTNPDLADALKESGRTGSRGARSQRIRSTLVVAQVALSLVLLVGAGLMLRSFARLLTTSAGFAPAGVVSAGVQMPGDAYASDEARTRFFRRVLERLESMPGIRAAGAINPLPVSGGGWQTAFSVEGRPEPEVGKYPTNDMARVSPNYFRTMGIRLIRGRPFDWHDDANGTPVAIIDETLASTFFAGEDPIGKRLRIGAPEHGPPGPWLSIVGVVNHVKNYGIDQESRVEIYLPFMQASLAGVTLLARGDGDTAGVTGAMRAAVREADPNLPIYAVRTMEEYLSRALTSRRLLMIVLALFAGVALTLAAVGVYGVMSYTVAQRTSEIGIRMALGAHPRHVLRLVVGHGMLLTAGGLLAGLAGASVITSLLTSMLFGVSPTDPATVGGAALLLATVAFVAVWMPARRASRVDPLIALRYE